MRATDLIVKRSTLCIGTVFLFSYFMDWREITIFFSGMLVYTAVKSFVTGEKI